MMHGTKSLKFIITSISGDKNPFEFRALIGF